MKSNSSTLSVLLANSLSELSLLRNCRKLYIHLSGLCTVFLQINRLFQDRIFKILFIDSNFYTMKFSMFSAVFAFRLPGLARSWRAFLVYRMSQLLSTSFFDFFSSFLRTLCRDSSFILPNLTCPVNMFFAFYFLSFLTVKTFVTL